MSQQFPFVRANPTDWSAGQKVTAAQINTLDKNAAQAADGLLWSDVAIVRNFSAKTTVTNAGKVVFWDGYLDRWIVAGDTGGAPVARGSADGRDEWIALTVPAGTNWNATISGASNGAGSMCLGGGGGSATASKIRQSSNGGDTWTARNTAASGAEAVRALIWFPAASLFVAGLNSTATTNIETSPDAITWTQRTAPNSAARWEFAVSPTRIVAIASTSTDKCIYSSNGVSWTEATLPATTTWTGIAWSARSAKFMAIGLGGKIATSSDGITWSSVGMTLPFPSISEGICAYGRIWVALGSRGSGNFLISASIDDGVSWQTVKTVADQFGHLATGDDQVLYVNSNNDSAYATIRGGGL